MKRNNLLLLIAIVLVGYGVYTAAYVPAMLVAPIEPLLLIGFILQVVFAFAAALGVWRGESWAPPTLLMLGISIAATSLIEAFVLGIVAYLRALLVASLAIVATWFAAACLVHESDDAAALWESRSRL